MPPDNPAQLISVGNDGSITVTIKANGLCSHYPTVPTGTAGTWDGNLGFSISTNGQIYILDPDFSGPTSAKWKEWLAEHPISCLM